MSNVPPPKSYTAIGASSRRSRPYRKGRRRGLVDDPLDLQARDSPGVAGGLTLRVVEIRRNRNHRLRDRHAQAASARATSRKIIADSSCGVIARPLISTRTVSFVPSRTPYGRNFKSSAMSAIPLPISRLTEYTVLSGFSTECTAPRCRP